MFRYEIGTPQKLQWRTMWPLRAPPSMAVTQRVTSGVHWQWEVVVMTTADHRSGTVVNQKKGNVLHEINYVCVVLAMLRLGSCISHYSPVTSLCMKTYQKVKI